MEVLFNETTASMLLHQQKTNSFCGTYKTSSGDVYELELSSRLQGTLEQLHLPSTDKLTKHRNDFPALFNTRFLLGLCMLSFQLKTMINMSVLFPKQSALLAPPMLKQYITPLRDSLIKKYKLSATEFANIFSGEIEHVVMLTGYFSENILNNIQEFDDHVNEYMHKYLERFFSDLFHEYIRSQEFGFDSLDKSRQDFVLATIKSLAGILPILFLDMPAETHQELKNLMYKEELEKFIMQVMHQQSEISTESNFLENLLNFACCFLIGRDVKKLDSSYNIINMLSTNIHILSMYQTFNTNVFTKEISHFFIETQRTYMRLFVEEVRPKIMVHLQNVKLVNAFELLFNSIENDSFYQSRNILLLPVIKNVLQSLQKNIANIGEGEIILSLLDLSVEINDLKLTSTLINLLSTNICDSIRALQKKNYFLAMPNYNQEIYDKKIQEMIVKITVKIYEAYGPSICGEENNSIEVNSKTKIKELLTKIEDVKKEDFVMQEEKSDLEKAISFVKFLADFANVSFFKTESEFKEQNADIITEGKRVDVCM